MMAAEFRGESAELTNQQKFHNLRRKMIVEVRLISHAGAGERWNEAVIKDANKEGAYCQLLNSPGQRFWHWRDVRPCLKTELPRQSATLGEVAQLHAPLPELPRREPLPPPPALTAAIVPRPAPPPLVTLVRTPPPPPPPPPQQPIAVSGRSMPIFVNLPSSAVGALVRPARLALNLSQDALAARLARVTGDPSLTNKRLSNLETGFRRPSEAEQLALVEVLKIDLTALITACDDDEAARDKEKRRKQQRARRKERAAEQGRTLVPRASAYRPVDAVREAIPRALKTPRASAHGQRFEAVEDMIEALIEIVPLPGDAATRKAWFRCARELFRLSTGE